MNYGYARVSSNSQNLDRQMDMFIALREQVPDLIIYTEKKSGKDVYSRAIWNEMVSKFEPGDVLFVSSIDRIGRNYDDIIKQWKHIRNLEVDIVVMDMPLLDTRSKQDLTGLVISDIVLQLLSYVAHKERENIKARQREGIESAKKKGKHLGRQRTLDLDVFSKYLNEVREGRMCPSMVWAELDISESTYYRYKKIIETREKI